MKRTSGIEKRCFNCGSPVPESCKTCIRHKGRLDDNWSLKKLTFEEWFKEVFLHKSEFFNKEDLRIAWITGQKNK